MPKVRIIGPGRAGTSLSAALCVAGWPRPELLGRGDDPAPAAHGVDFLVLAVPDDAIAGVAGSVDPDDQAVVVHLSGCHGLDVLVPHPRRASVHPLVSMPAANLGASRLAGAWFAFSGDGAARRIPEALGGRVIDLPDDALTRARYHAAACVASNHLVALLGQVERIAADAGVPLAAYLDLVRATVDNVAALGPAAALTGPAARGDLLTLERHRWAIPAGERAAYDALVEEAMKLVRAEEPACS